MTNTPSFTTIGTAEHGSLPHRDAKREVAARRCRATLALVLGLLAQFVLGMYLNLYVPHPHSQPALIAHIALGSLLVVAGAFVTAMQSRRGDHILTATLGLAALVLAWTGGIRFLQAGGQSIDSYLMILGFTGAVAACTTGLITLYRQSPPERTHDDRPSPQTATPSKIGLERPHRDRLASARAAML